MKDLWYGIVGVERSAMQKVDEDSVKCLECNPSPSPPGGAERKLGIYIGS